MTTPTDQHHEAPSVEAAAPAGPDDAAGAPARSRRRPPRWALEVGTAVALVVLLEVLVFWDYFTGVNAPPWDFMGAYNTDAYAWWEGGSFFDPAEWITHGWGGYPAAASIQNSAWYLPVGVVAALVPFTIHASAALAAVHYGIGALGMYALGRAHGLRPAAAAVGLSAWFFVQGFFAQAEFVDIARGYAWLPWLLLLTSPHWPWRRWWAVPLAAVALWQMLLGVYPGMIVAAGYCVSVWILVNQLTSRRALRDYLLPLSVSAGLALALSAPKYVPAVLLAGTNSEAADSSQLSWGLLATAFMPYGRADLPSDIAMRSFFLPCTVFVLVGVLRHLTGPVRAALAMLGTAVVLGIPGAPWSGVAGLLPGMGISRFRLSDFRSFLLVALCLLAMIAVHQLAQRSSDPARARPGDLRLRWWLALVSLGVPTLAIATRYTRPEWVVPTVLTAVTALVVASAARVLPRAWAGRPFATRQAGALLVGLSVLSGTWWAYATPAPWLSSRVFAETVTYGTTVDELLEEADDRTEDADPQSTEQRPARTPLPEPITPEALLSPVWNGGYYSGEDSVGGYVNLKRSESYTALYAALTDPATAEAVNDLYAAPGLLVQLDGGPLPSGESLESCAAAGDCGPALEATPDGYEAGDLNYDVTASAPVTVAANEPYYLGWRVTACSPDGTCEAVSAGRGPAGVTIFDLPQGQWDVQLEYVPPGSEKAWWAFRAAGAALTTWLVLAAIRGWSARHPTRPDP